MKPRLSQRLIRPVRELPSAASTNSFWRFVGLLLPPVLLVLAAFQSAPPPRYWLLGGALGCLVLGFLLHRAGDRNTWLSPSALLPFVGGLLWQWISKPDLTHPLQRIVQAILLLCAVGLFAWQTVHASGGPTVRRARYWARRLSSRKEWPATLDDCRTVPELDPLRNAIAEDAGPALPLLLHDKPQVQIAALAALEFRRGWRFGQADHVLRLAQSSPHPDIRAAAVLALGHVDQRLLIEALADTLRDSAIQVRQAAVETLLWDTESRWILIRHAVHDALADPRFSKDGPFAPMRGRFSPAAIADLIAWSTESGILGTRATQTLAKHYNAQLISNPTPQLLKQLCDLVVNPRATTVMRIELAHLLIQHEHMSEELLEQLLNPANPSPLRLLAVESLLQAHKHDQAIEVLRDVARQPNRELALTAATLVQKYLHVDLGLALGAPPPPIHSREAAEVTRRIMEWANHSFAAPASSASQGAHSDWMV